MNNFYKKLKILKFTLLVGELDSLEFDKLEAAATKFNSSFLRTYLL